MSFRACGVLASAVVFLLLTGYGLPLTKPEEWIRLVYFVVIWEQYQVCQLTLGYLSNYDVSCRSADSQFRPVPAEVVVFRLLVVAYTSGRLVTRCMILSVYSHPGLLLNLQNSPSLTSHRELLLFVG